MAYRWLFILFLLPAAGCVAKTGDEPSNQADDTDTSEVPVVTSQAGLLCGELDCEADVKTGRAALAAGNFEAAYDAYKCGDTVEAAFGAALTQLLLVPETDAVTATVARLGYGPLNARDFAGPGSLLYQNGQRWSGSGSLRIESNGISEETTLPLAHIDWDNGINIEASDDHLDTSVDLYIEISAFTPTAGEALFALSDYCALAAGNPVVDDYFYIDVWKQGGDSDIDCYFSFSSLLNTPCEDLTGSIAVTEMGSANTPATIEWEGLPVECTDWSGSDPAWTATLSGEITGLVTHRDMDLSGYHPLLQDDDTFWDTVPLDITVGDLITDAEPLIDVFERIGCYASQADNGGAGPVFVIPKDVNGKADMPVSASDALLTAASAYATAAGIAMGNSYDYNLRFRMLDEMSVAEQAAEINTSVPKLKAGHRFEEARGLLDAALDAMVRGVETIYPDGIWVDTPSLRGREDLYDWASTALISLRNGPAIIPASDPPLTLNLKALFDNPPDPSKLDMDPVVVEIDEWGYENMEGVETYFQALAGNVIPGFDFDMEDNGLFTDPDGWMEDYFESMIFSPCELMGCDL